MGAGGRGGGAVVVVRRGTVVFVVFTEGPILSGPIVTSATSFQSGNCDQRRAGWYPAPPHGHGLQTAAAAALLTLLRLVL